MKTVVLSDQRDIPVLGFIWRWKLVTTRALQAVFFSDCSLATAYNRLLKLESAGFIKSVCNERGQNFHWTLTKKGFGAISSLLPPLREEGFRSEHVRHDSLVTAFHLGEWLIERPKGVELFSEQQLRRYAEESMPQWVPKPDIHRPDGYWALPSPNGLSAVAIEVELGQKGTSFYQGIADFYAHEESVFRVLWLVELPACGRAIQKIVSNSASPRGDIHNFIVLGQFLQHGWAATIQRGPETGATIRDFFERHLGHLGHETAMNRSCRFMTPFLLDARKSRGKTGDSGKFPRL